MGAVEEMMGVSSELLMCGGGVRSILLLSLVARCLETIDLCIWRMLLFMSVVVIVWWSEGIIILKSNQRHHRLTVSKIDSR